MPDLHLPLNLGKTELLVLLANQSIYDNTDLNIATWSLGSPKAVEILGVLINDQLTFS